MTGSHLLDAIGLLDDDLIQEAEEYTAVRKRFDYRRWGSLAACCALVLALGYGALWLAGGGDLKKGLDQSGASGGAASMPAASAPAGGNSLPWDEADGSLNEAYPPAPDSPSGSGPAEPAAPGAVEGGEPAIMVEGVLYQSTGMQVPAEPDPASTRTVVSYTSGVPEMDGQTNFSQDLSARYAMTGMGLLVLVDEEWTLFEPVP